MRALTKSTPPASPFFRNRGKWNRWLRGWRAWWMMRKGWRCEGPFPRKNGQALIILSPGFTRESVAFDLLDFRLRYQARWHAPGAPRTSAADATDLWEGIILLEGTSQYLSNVLKEAAQQEVSVQLVTLVAPLKRIRCNTPFLPGRHTERECAYIDRLFSYCD